MFEAHQICVLLDAASAQIKAMILLAINCGFGNNDCGSLPKSAVDLDGGWVSFPRPKTGIKRRVPLWPETINALRAALDDRLRASDEDGTENLFFLTKYGKSWSQNTSTNPISAEFRKLAQSLGLYRKGNGFYAIRHTFLTIGDETKDFVAVASIMGHSDESMADRYRERVSDDRLKAVTDHVRDWLFSDSDKK